MAYLTQVGEDCRPSSLDPWAEVPKERRPARLSPGVPPCALWRPSTGSRVMS